MRNLPRIVAVGALASALILTGCASSDEGAATAGSKGALAIWHVGEIPEAPAGSSGGH